MAPRLGTLFDFNGVLVDDEHLHHLAMAEVVAPLGVALGRDDYFGRYFALDDAGAFRAILEDAALDASQGRVDALVDAKKPVYLAHANRAELFAGGAELVRACAAAGPVVIVSGALRHEIELILERMGARAHVLAIVSAEDTARCKPDPEGYLRGSELARAAGAEVLVAIEDSPGGVRAARAAGLEVVAVLHSVSEASLREAGAGSVVRAVGELDVDTLAALAR